MSAPAPASPKAIGLAELFSELGRYEKRVPLHVMKSAVARLLVSPRDIAEFVVFDEHRYRRNTICSGPAFEALLLCWCPGQRSPVHDHRGSGCAFRVLEGTVSETVFEPGAGDRLYPIFRRRYRPGSVSVSEDRDIHEVANVDQERLVTLHIYSPPLVGMTTYRPEVCARVAELPLEPDPHCARS